MDTVVAVVDGVADVVAGDSAADVAVETVEVAVVATFKNDTKSKKFWEFFSEKKIGFSEKKILDHLFFLLNCHTCTIIKKSVILLFFHHHVI